MVEVTKNVCHVCLIAGLFLIISCDVGTTQQDQTPVLKPEEMYRDMFPLTRENFTEKVLRSKDPWIVIFHDGNMERAWKTMATHLRGLCWIGMVDVREEAKFLAELVRYFSTLYERCTCKFSTNSLNCIGETSLCICMLACTKCDNLASGLALC